MKNYEEEEVVEMPDKKPNLFNIVAEQVVLGTIILNNNYLFKVSEFLTKEHFYEPAHQIIFEHIIYITKRANIVADSITLKSFFDNDEFLKTIGGSKYLSILLSMGAGIVDIENYSFMIIDLFKKRLLISLGEKIINEVYEKASLLTSDSIIENTAQDLNNLQDDAGFEKKTKHLNHSISDELVEIEETMKDKNYRSKNYIKTGYYDFDNKFKGFKRGELIILAGRPAMGKSTISLNIASNIALNDYHVIFFSLEMKASELATKILANCTKINSEEIETGKITKKQFKNMGTSYISLLSKKKFYINDKSDTNCNYIKNILNRAKRIDNPVDFIVVDYLQLMEGKTHKNMNKNHEIGAIMKNLLKIAKDFNCVVLCLSQLSRAIESRDDKRPRLQDLRDSGNIEQIANMVIGCYREVYYLEKELESLDEENEDEKISYNNLISKIQKKENDLELLIRKNRRGKTGKTVLYYKPEFSYIGNKWLG